MKLNVNNETAQLEVVLLGIGEDRGEPRILNPVSRYHFNKGTFPKDDDIVYELSTFEKILKENGVEVLRPKNIPGVEQIFTRDIGFVIGEKFFVANMKKASRRAEQPALEEILNQIDPLKIYEIPDPAIAEGGDVIIHNDYVFVGISERTNWEGYEFIKKMCPEKKVFAFELIVNDDYKESVLHLDCVFQPIGEDEAIFYEEGFVKEPKELKEIFPEEKLIRVSQDEKVRMFPNVFSISPKKIVIERNFVELKEILEKKGYKVYEAKYSETSKLSGLLRCSTLPLRRKM